MSPRDQDLMERYIYAVTRRLPRAQREEIADELRELIGDMLEADPAEPVRCKPDENSRVGWFGLEEAVAASTEPWFRERIYKKLNEKLAGFPAGR